MTEQHHLTIVTRGRGSTEITANIAALVRSAAVDTGIAHIFARHTSCGLAITENADPAVLALVWCSYTYLDRYLPSLYDQGRAEQIDRNAGVGENVDPSPAAARDRRARGKPRCRSLGLSFGGGKLTGEQLAQHDLLLLLGGWLSHLLVLSK